ncbi:HAD-IIIC family phosphatase [Salipaludibacillus agaradhaerens]|uniref:HAD-IIIC family phosphatase n=1 Tax=Salipaludibacillus agaradhaerens TaxID=76935 RepID=UPI00215100DE|nr:HAD-IIIC family phosphatase [Salipaludibacillus agaradhaerens]MCR6105808.1 HAD-IIIC family phosphatase [Salipaludibacillus agaradhaerens]MCR6117844.1 HAD-IIIC family phosphatase [Salipaludibacillus agaradhaerens]
MKAKNNKNIKCVVWDLDNTLWEGTLLEDNNVYLRKNIINIIKTIDSRGILQSIASKNHEDTALQKLKEFNLLEYFLYPKVGWNPKSESIKKISEELNLGIDTIAFIDDQDFELDEVAFNFEEVRCININDIDNILNLPEMNPSFITDESKVRRKMYIADIERNAAEEDFNGPVENFLSTLGMSLKVATAQEEDLKRAEELTKRTNQLNTTGYTYSYDELNKLRQSDSHKLYVASLKDKYGTYGKIGLALLECNKELWDIKLLLMSCRVMSRGIGTILLTYIMNEAKKYGKRLTAEYRPNGRNRQMYVTYKFIGFKEIKENDKLIVLENDLSFIQSYPDYVNLEIEERETRKV